MLRYLIFAALAIMATPMALAQNASADRDLLAAAERGDAAGAQTALAAGANPNARDTAQRTALIVTGENGAIAVARLLIAARADVNIRDNRAYDALTQAAARGDHALVGVLLDAGADVTIITSPYRGTALIAAAHHEHVEAIRLLLAKKPPIDHVNNLGWTALMEAIVLGDGGPRHTETLRVLLAAGANPNIADRDGVTPLGQAKRRGFAEMVKVLETAGAKR